MPALTVRSKFTFKITGVSADLAVSEFTLEERLSNPYRADLMLASTDAVNLDDVLGKEAQLTIAGDDGSKTVQGIVSRFAQVGKKGRFILYEARLVPQMWLLSQRQDSRIFQNQDLKKTVSEILKDISLPTDRYDFRLQETYKTKDYCVQYQETDFSFLSRLLENDGVYYFFEQAKDKHVLVLADGKSAYKPISGNASISFRQGEGLVPQDEVVYQFGAERQIGPGKFTHTDFNYQKPSTPLQANDSGKKNTGLETYEHPGGYEEAEDGQKLAKLRMQEKAVQQEMGLGSSTCPRLTAGYTFKLKEHETKSFNREYLVVSVIHRGKQPQSFEETITGGALSYSNEFTVIPSELVFRPARITPEPYVQGPQTAIVVGPENEEIYTDDQGRVKVKFHWDRSGAKDEQSSCWIRVGQLWAGEGWGSVFIPRKNQEVIVSFLDGDPDRPIITGRVYNGASPVPHALPASKTKSTIMSQSLSGKGGNELSFEDAQGKEEVYLHGEKDLTVKVDNNKSQNIGSSDSKIVLGNQSQSVAGNQSNQVGKTKNETVTMASNENVGLAKAVNVGGAYSTNVGAAYSLIVAAGMNTAVGMAQAEEVGLQKSIVVGKNFNTSVQEDYHLNVTGNQSSDAGKTYKLNVGESIEIVCGRSSLRMDKEGNVTLNGKQFMFQASGDVTINGHTIQLNP